MRVVGKIALEVYWRSHASARRPLAAWLRVAEQATWQNIMEVRQTYPTADFVKPYTVFNIKGNSYRLITVINYKSQLLSIEKCMTHSEYSKEDWK